MNFPASSVKLPILVLAVGVLLLSLFGENGVAGSTPRTRKHHKVDGVKGHFLMAAQLPQGLGLAHFVIDRSSRVEEGQQTLGKADFHGPLSGLILPLNGAYKILGDFYGLAVRNEFIRNLPLLGDVAKVGQMVNDYMDMQGNVFVEVLGEELVHDLYQEDGQHSDEFRAKLAGRYF